MSENPVVKTVVAEDFCPLDYLSEKERDVVWAIINIIEATIIDQELKDNMIGSLFYECEEFGERGKDGGTH